MVDAYVARRLPQSIRGEADAIAARCGVSLAELMTANLYYDLIKGLLGCTAIAIDTPDGPLHARNLDWWSDNNALASLTCVTQYIDSSRDDDHRDFQSVGWPGFLGVFSGLAPGRFAVTMNAVVSGDRPAFATSVPLAIRDTLTNAVDYADAVERLSTQPMITDCLLMVTGIRPGEMIVIERTPTRHAVRSPEGGRLVLTNDYKVLDKPVQAAATPLLQTAAPRFGTATRRLREDSPSKPEQCFAILSDDHVKMSITMQQMTMSAATGELTVRIAADDDR